MAEMPSNAVSESRHPYVPVLGARVVVGLGHPLLGSEVCRQPPPNPRPVDDALSAGHPCPMDSINLDRRFTPWRFGIGHAQLLLRGRTHDGDTQRLSVLFEDVRAVKLRRSYQPLQLRRAEPDSRDQILDFAQIPDRRWARYVCVTLPVEDLGFVVCGRATVLTADIEANPSDPWWPEHARVLHVLKNDTPSLGQRHNG